MKNVLFIKNIRNSFFKEKATLFDLVGRRKIGIFQLALYLDSGLFLGTGKCITHTTKE